MQKYINHNLLIGAVSHVSDVAHGPLVIFLVDNAAMFLFANGDKDVFEVSAFSESCRSWLIDDFVQQGKGQAHEALKSF